MFPYQMFPEHFISSNPKLFLQSDWVEVEKLKAFLTPLGAARSASFHLGNSTGTPAGTQSSTRTRTCTGSNPSTHGLVHDRYMRVHAGVNSRTGFAKYIIILSKLNYSN